MSVSYLLLHLSWDSGQLQSGKDYPKRTMNIPLDHMLPVIISGRHNILGGWGGIKYSFRYEYLFYFGGGGQTTHKLFCFFKAGERNQMETLIMSYCKHAHTTCCVLDKLWGQIWWHPKAPATAGRCNWTTRHNSNGSKISDHCLHPVSVGASLGK